jgi:hypothetical protein
MYINSCVISILSVSLRLLGHLLPDVGRHVRRLTLVVLFPVSHHSTVVAGVLDPSQRDPGRVVAGLLSSPIQLALDWGGASPKILICVSRPRRKSKRMSVHCTYTCRVWNTLGCLQDTGEDSHHAISVITVLGHPLYTCEYRLGARAWQGFVDILSL